jgi:hypothetical protein
MDNEWIKNLPTLVEKFIKALPEIDGFEFSNQEKNKNEDLHLILETHGLTQLSSDDFSLLYNLCKRLDYKHPQIR